MTCRLSTVYDNLKKADGICWIVHATEGASTAFSFFSFFLILLTCLPKELDIARGRSIGVA